MPIPEAFLDELVARSDLAEIVGEYVHLTPKGGSLWGCCPFHNEKTASFHVVPERQIFKCFGCGKGGGVITFVMEMEHLSWLDAVRFLARRVNMEVPETSGGKEAGRRRQRCIEANTAAARFFRNVLEKCPEGQAVREYIAQRRISPRFSARFGLGAAPEGWDTLKNALTSQGFSKQELLEAGLLVAGRHGGVYDKFRARLMLPVIHVGGEVVGFTSRILPGAAGAKYLNSPDTPCFKKSRTLYALNYAKNTKRSHLILVEGNLDVITLHQAGFDNAVATMGTSLTGEHARILTRYCKELVVCYDNDAAGKKSTDRALGILKDTTLHVRVLQLPNAVNASGEAVKQDPDDFIKRYGSAAFDQCLAGALEGNDYKLNLLLQGVHLERPEEKQTFARAAIETVGRMDSAVEREIYGRKAAEAIGVTEAAFAQEVDRWRRGAARRERRREQRRELAPAVTVQPRNRSLQYTDVRSARAEEGVIRLALLEPSLLNRADIEPEQFSSPTLGKAFALLRDRYRRGLSVQLAALEGAFTMGEMDQIAAAVLEPESLTNGSQAMADYIKIIRSQAEQRRTSRGADALMAFRAMQRETKAMEGGQ